MTARIDIWYLLTGSDSETHFSLSPESYFDPLEPGESYEENGVPRHNFTWQYIDAPRERLIWSVERRAGVNDPTTFSTQYFQEGRSWVNHRRDPDGFEELIHAFDLSETYLTIRSSKQPGGRWVCHTALANQAGTDSELWSLPCNSLDLTNRLSTRLAEVAGS